MSAAELAGTSPRFLQDLAGLVRVIASGKPRSTATARRPGSVFISGLWEGDTVQLDLRGSNRTWSHLAAPRPKIPNARRGNHLMTGWPAECPSARFQ